ncbi:anoctamin-4 isoform X2 [Chrysoperla carnea]|uniref:anoctamin-4 isoform X2 n=1 Tax=Chrysoperla carnea TaxID=189513 RepID=UPI001D05F8D9|nr:anoctamin-4 isoform X2 [Chrysoperla carnea]
MANNVEDCSINTEEEANYSPNKNENQREFTVVYKPLSSYEHVLNEKTVRNDLAAMSVLSLYQSAKDLETMDIAIHSESENEDQSIPLSEIKLDDENHLSPKSSTPNSAKNPTDCPCKLYPNSIKLVSCPMPSLYFEDGKRSVDFILVWDSFIDVAITEIATERRAVFEKNLMAEGLELEYEPVNETGLNFIKIHVPHEVLRRYSEILKLRMPMKEIPGLEKMHNKTNTFFDEMNSYWDAFWSKIYVDKRVFPERSHRFTAVYSRDREYLFDLDSPCFFTPAIHSRIAQFILDRKRFSDNENDDFAFGIERLINDYTYSAAYPLHDGDLRTAGSMRHLLYHEWAALRKWYRYQPLDYIKEYFGVKIALYFAWLGFYTHMLLPASIVGVACFIYSWLTLDSNRLCQDICKEDLNIKMCPICDHWCDYFDIKATCLHSKITYLFDNPTTVFFAIFMSFWATCFLELWKRYSAEITHRWDLTGFDVKEEHPRPQYLARLAHVKRRRINIITNTMEPLVPFWRVKVPATILSFSVVLLLVALAVAAVIAVVLYRMSVLTALSWYGGKDSVITSNAILFTTATAASINLCCIMVFNWIYTYVAQYLTEVELLRTQTEFDDSLTLKIYLLQFVNYYASIFYIAFIKGKYVGYPGNYIRLFGYRQEECGPGGCLLELCIQLAIIMIGKQAMNTILEMILPIFYKWFYTLKTKTGIHREQLSLKNPVQWYKDFKLLDWGARGLFPEYLEMVLQYGFVTIFVAAFPLAPFFALLNNILEMRLDAKKLLTFYRRPVTQRVRDIGVWYRILDSIGKLSVITNGFIIAFTSDFIPRLVYRFVESPDGSLNGYLNSSLSYFNTSDFQVGSAPRNTQFGNLTICRYPDYREPPWSPNRYDKTIIAWIILAAKLGFVVIFENVVAVVMIVVRWGIPDMSTELKERIRRETFITNEIIIKQETLRAQSGEYKKDEIGKQEDRRIEIPTTPEQWDHLINKSLSGSDFDLFVHGDAKDLNDRNTV